MKNLYRSGGAGDYGGRLASCYDFKWQVVLIPAIKPRFFPVFLVVL